MTCEVANRELVECARGMASPEGALEAHLAACDSCRERWDAQRVLTSHLNFVRGAGLAGGFDAASDFKWSKTVLLREFDAHRRQVRQIRWVRALSWSMSAAAILVLSVVAFRDVFQSSAADRAPRGSQVVRAYAPREYPRENFVPAEEAGEEGFIKVPFALPPAPGETFGIVRTELDPVQLTRLGVNVDPAWTGTLQAEVLVGEDGLAQAVRLSNDDAGLSGSDAGLSGSDAGLSGDDAGLSGSGTQPSGSGNGGN